MLPASHGPCRRRLVLFLAASWSAALPVVAGRPMELGELSPLPLLAAAEPPALEPSLTPAVAETPSASRNAMVNLLNRLVERKILPKEDAADLIQMAEADAAAASAQAAATQESARQVVVAVQAIANQPPPPPPIFPKNPAIPPPSDDQIRVTYIPEIVKAQMRDQIKAEVLAQAREERWVAPNTMPEWVPRFRVAGDVRVRYEGLFYPEGNDNTGAFPNFNAINTGSPFDVAGTVFSDQYNVDQNRNRFRLRARLSADIDLGEGFSGGLRIATGETNSPTSPNQTLGGSGGNFSKYAIWLDRAFLKYELGGQPSANLAINVGRFDNPFFSTSMIWDDDLGFDGIAVLGKYEVAKGLTPFLTLGAFPVFNTSLNFASNRPDKFDSQDKYLYATQTGTEWKIAKDLSAKIAVAYYYFDNIAGRLSSPFTPLNNRDAGDTDDTRPSFAQRGNTYRPLRDIVATADNEFGTTNQFQYFGLATPFHELAVTGRIDYKRFEPVQLSLLGEWVKNLAFDDSETNNIAINNRGPNSSTGALGNFDGGDTAWMIALRIGHAALEKRWDWNFQVEYRYVESDAVVDGFAESDFGGGGTNLRGYIVGGSLALGKRVWLGTRWMSANEIAGPPFRNDIFQFDINGKF